MVERGGWWHPDRTNLDPPPGLDPLPRSLASGRQARAEHGRVIGVAWIEGAVGDTVSRDPKGSASVGSGLRKYHRVTSCLILPQSLFRPQPQILPS